MGIIFEKKHLIFQIKWYKGYNDLDQKLTIPSLADFKFRDLGTHTMSNITYNPEIPPKYA